MSISKRESWLTLAIVVLVLIASIAGLALTSTYARETTPHAIQAMGQDIANLVSIAVLLVAVYFASKGSVKAFLVWMGPCSRCCMRTSSMPLLPTLTTCFWCMWRFLACLFTRF